MNRRLIIRPEAESDIIDAAVWYENREVSLGLEIAGEVHAAIKRAVEHPRAHPLLRKHPEVHRILAQRFPYRIYYIVRSDAIVIFAVLHSSRHERNWEVRIEQSRS
jgi:plasmid stabilization system protein ParE